MPIDYKNYPNNWLTEIRPDILKRANNCCELCKVPNDEYVVRGEVILIEGDRRVGVYQDMSGMVYNDNTGEKLGTTVIGELDGDVRSVKIVLTIAHLDHDIQNNDYSNLKALCQQCHNRYDKQNRAKNRLKNKEKRFISLFED